MENTKTISESTSRRPSVFERLGPSTGSTTEVSCYTVETGSLLEGIRNVTRWQSPYLAYTKGPHPRSCVLGEHLKYYY